MSTYMWKTGKSEYRFQTDNPKIAKKLSRRKNSNLVSWGINQYLRVYQICPIRPDKARRLLSHIETQEKKMTSV